MSECIPVQPVMRVGNTYKNKRTGQLLTLQRASGGMVYLQAMVAGGGSLPSLQATQIMVSPQQLQELYELVTAGAQ